MFVPSTNDMSARVPHSGLHRMGLAGSGAHLVKLHGPFKPGLIGCLHDLILDAFVIYCAPSMCRRTSLRGSGLAKALLPTCFYVR